MLLSQSAVEGVWHVAIEPSRDDRGFFARMWCRGEFADVGLDLEWAQANVAHNPACGTLRGMHFQRDPYGEWKLVRCTRGRVYDVAVDIRRDSPTYGRWVASELSADGGEMLLIPPGCAHGYLTLEPNSDLMYFTSVPYRRDAASGVRFDDPTLAISWVGSVILVSEQDRSWPLLEQLPPT